MRRWILGLSAAIAAAVVVALAAGRTGVRAGEGAPPEGQYRVEVNHIVRDDRLIVTQVEVTAPPRSMVRVFTDVSNQGGLSLRSPDSSRGGAPPERVRLTIVGDHVKSASGKADLVKIMLKGEGGSGSATSSSEGPMPERTDLKNLLSVKAKAGTYRLGTPVELYTHRGTAYGLVVDRPSGP